MKMNKKSFWNTLEKALHSVIPVVQDSPREWMRKLAFLLAFLVFIGSSWYLVDDLWIQPNRTKETANTLRNWFYADPDEGDLLPDGEVDTTVYPEGMAAKFKMLYRANSDVRGWIRFAAGEGTNDLFEGAIDNPITLTADNDYYLDHDFWGEYDKAGTLFFDYRNDLDPNAQNRNLIVYGHNLNSGLMFSRFNKLASAKLERGRSLTTLTLDTLYEQRAYKVFAVMVLNVDESEGPVFNYLRTKFASEKDFLNYVGEIRKRSLFDFGAVDVQAGDELLTLSTCSNKRDTTLKDGRIVVVARRVREGEDPAVDPMLTTVNDDVLMPKAWYVNKGLAVPQVYSTTPSTTTTPSAAGTTTTQTLPDTSEVTTVPSGDTTGSTTLSGGPSQSTTLPSGATSSTVTGDTASPSAGETTTTGAAQETTATAETTTTGAAQETTATTAAQETTATTAAQETTATTAAQETTTTTVAQETTTTTETAATTATE